MKESVIYQDILAQGEQKGRTEGRTEEARSIITRLLTKRFGSLSIELRAKINALEIDRVESLGEDLLDFKTINDLLVWFDLV